MTTPAKPTILDKGQKRQVQKEIIKSTLIAGLLPEHVPVPKIVNEWTETNTYRAEVPHNSNPADPQVNCTGTISVTFQLKARTGTKRFGTKITYCQQCKEPVEVSITALALELGLI